MFFQNPNALWALLSLIVPIVLHFFNFRRYKTLYFSNVSFLWNVQTTTKSKSTLRKLLLLIVRLFLITILVLMFARPVFSIEANEQTSNVVSIYIDNSRSLEQLDDFGNPLLYRVIERLQSGVAPASEDQYFNFMDNNGEANSGSNISSYHPKLTNKKLVFDELVDRLNQNSIKDVNVYSEFQRSTLGDLEKVFNDSTTAYNFNLLAIERGFENIYIDSLWLEESGHRGGSNRLQIKLVNSGNTERENILVRVSQEDSQLFSKSISINANSSKLVKVDLGSNKDYSGRYEVAINDEYLTFDNKFYFQIPTREKVNVLIVNNVNVNISFLTAVFGNRELFELSINSVENVNFDQLKATNLIVLNGFNSTPPWLDIDRIETKVLYLPNENSRNTAIDINGFNLTLVDTQSSELARETIESEIFKGVLNDKPENMALPFAKPIFEIAGYVKTHIELENGSKLLVQNLNGDYLLNTVFNDSNTNLHKHALFVPMMYQIANNAINEPLYCRLDEQTFMAKLPPEYNSDNLRLIGNGLALYPNARINNKELVIDIPEELEQSGHYNLIYAGDTLARLAFNYDKAESNVEVYSFEELKRITSPYNHIKVSEINGGMDFGNKNASSIWEFALWKYALFLVLVFILTESLIIRFSK
ncbi:MAG: hypothetical protein ACI83W_001274 [Marinoscillum sp.]|jgi:hypothetical protein